jgi:hypothetical protein
MSGVTAFLPQFRRFECLKLAVWCPSAFLLPNRSLAPFRRSSGWSGTANNIGKVSLNKTDACRMIWLDPSIGATTLLIGSMLSSEHNGQTDNATRRNAKATMDHADIRGLVTALHLSVAGLPTV